MLPILAASLFIVSFECGAERGWEQSLVTKSGSPCSGNECQDFDGGANRYL